MQGFHDTNIFLHVVFGSTIRLHLHDFVFTCWLPASQISFQASPGDVFTCVSQKKEVQHINKQKTVTMETGRTQPPERSGSCVRIQPDNLALLGLKCRIEMCTWAVHVLMLCMYTCVTRSWWCVGPLVLQCA